MSDQQASAAITPLKRVSAYRTSDGAIHETRAAAELREAHLGLEQLVDTLDGAEGMVAITALSDQAHTIHAALTRLLKARAAVAKAVAK